MSPQVQRVWKYLYDQELAESNWPLRDDLRIAKICVLEAGRGNPNPWLWAFWKHMGMYYHKYIGIIAEREAYRKLLGPTLEEQLRDPLFLATLEPLARPFYWQPQMKLDFSRTAEDQAILDTIESEGAGDAKAAAALPSKALHISPTKAARTGIVEETTRSRTKSSARSAGIQSVKTASGHEATKRSRMRKALARKSAA